MKKNLGLASLLLVSSLYGAETRDDSGKFYVGAGYFTGSGTHSVERSNGYSDYDMDFDVSSIPVSVGYVLDSQDRLELTYSSNDIDFDNSSITVKAINLDYNIVINSWETAKLLPYVGLGFGYYSWDDSGSNFQNGEDLKGVGYDLSFGALYSITDSVEFEAAYQIKTIQWQEIQYSTHNAELSDVLSGIYVGLNLKF